MHLKELRKLINEEVKRYKVKEQERDLGPDEKTITDPNRTAIVPGIGGQRPQPVDPNKTPPATPTAILGQPRPKKPQSTELPPELQGDDGFEGFGEPQMLDPSDAGDPTDPIYVPPSKKKAVQSSQSKSGDYAALLDNPNFLAALKGKLGLDIPEQYRDPKGEKTKR